MKKIRFLHAADLHLDSPFKGLTHLPPEIFNQIKNSTFRALANLIDMAIKKEVNLLLLSGDLFDLEQRSLYAQATLRKEFVRLWQAGIQVYIIHGNHDYVTENHRLFRYPENVHVFKETVECEPFIKNGTHLANIYGFSYSRRHTTENMTKHYRKSNTSVPFHIGMLHGNLSGREEHDPYAPFSIRELLEKEFDYWALGHIHKREILHKNPPIVYPGNIQGRHKKETGGKGCYIVELTEGGRAELEYVETSPIDWEEVEISIKGLESLDQLMEVTRKALIAQKAEDKSKLVRLIYKGSGALHQSLQDESKQEDLQVLLNEGEDNRNPFIYIYSLHVRTTGAFNRESLQEKSFYRDFYSMLEQMEDMEEVLSALYRHSEARHYLEPLDDEDKREILGEAEQWLVTRFLESEKR
ncbi:hypothetical protein AB685_13950 [Bacillus sp. LL01]|nr:hypothetical protein AB685_13950 [Bacillus sp. LL01]